MTVNKSASSGWKNSPGMWFSILCNALAEQDLATAAQAKENLKRLGVRVRFRGLTLVRQEGTGLVVREETVHA